MHTHTRCSASRLYPIQPTYNYTELLQDTYTYKIPIQTPAALGNTLLSTDTCILKAPSPAQDSLPPYQKRESPDHEPRLRPSRKPGDACGLVRSAWLLSLLLVCGVVEGEREKGRERGREGESAGERGGGGERGREREREGGRGREGGVAHTYMHIYIYIYIYVYVHARTHYTHT